MPRAPILKPCPYCGHQPTRIDIVACGVFAVCCPECNTTGPRIRVAPMEDRNEISLARNAWNRRSSGKKHSGGKEDDLGPLVPQGDNASDES